MGFPKEQQIVCSDTRAYKQFGNSVVVPVVTEIAKAIVAALSEENQSQTIKKVEQEKGKLNTTFVRAA